MSDESKTTEVKSGYKTTEFWFSAIAAIVSFLLASGVVAEGSQVAEIIGYVGGALTAMGYTVSRGIAKK